MKNFKKMSLIAIATVAMLTLQIAPVFGAGMPSSPYTPYSPYKPHKPVDTSLGLQGDLLVVGAIAMYFIGAMIVSNSSNIKNLLKKA